MLLSPVPWRNYKSSAGTDFRRFGDLGLEAQIDPQRSQHRCRRTSFFALTVLAAPARLLRHPPKEASKNPLDARWLPRKFRPMLCRE
jgi:hypothetical protein